MRTRVLIALAAITMLAGCGSGSDKSNEQFKDAPRSGTNNAPAEVGTMPDGFSNWATKCDHGNRVYVIFHNDGAYGSIAVVPDKSCVVAR